MNATLDAIKTELQLIEAAVLSLFANDEPLNIAHSNWSYPGLNRNELARMCRKLIQYIDSLGTEEGKNKGLVSDYGRRLEFVRHQTVPQLNSNPATAVPAFQATLHGLRDALAEEFPSPAESRAAAALEASAKLRALESSLRKLQDRITVATTRTGNLDSKIEVIDKVHAAARMLPDDLNALSEAREEVDELVRDAASDQKRINAILEQIAQHEESLDASKERADDVLDRADAAFRALTSQGLAAAFIARSKRLATSMWVWVAGLVAALLIGGIFGTAQLQDLLKITRSSGEAISYVELWIRVFLGLLSVAGPVWFAWIATKQIGQRFRLAEDYGYKATISAAYEGYRREASLIDPALQQRLFASALTRLDELPLRLVESESHGSPWHELMNSSAVRKASETVPGFFDSIKQIAEAAVKRSTSPASGVEEKAKG